VSRFAISPTVSVPFATLAEVPPEVVVAAGALVVVGEGAAAGCPLLDASATIPAPAPPPTRAAAATAAAILFLAMLGPFSAISVSAAKVPRPRYATPEGDLRSP
jgi:hypothetical protein